MGNPLGNPKGGLAKGGLARKAPIGPKRALSGQFLLFPRGCGVRRNWSRSAPKRPRSALKWPQFAPKRPDFPGRISPRFSLKIWGLSPRLWAPVWIFPKPLVWKPPDWSSPNVQGCIKPPNRFGASSPVLPFLVFFWKIARKTAKKTRIFYPCRTPKIPGKEGKNAQKTEFLAGKKNKEFQKKQGKEGQGLLPPQLTHFLFQVCEAEGRPFASANAPGQAIYLCFWKNTQRTQPY